MSLFDHTDEMALLVSRITFSDLGAEEKPVCQLVAEEELFCLYKNAVWITVRHIVRNKPAAEDVCQETFRIALEKIRNGDVREPERLSRFICGVARNIAIKHARNSRHLAIHEDLERAKQVPDITPNQFDQIANEEMAEIVLQVLNQLKLPRDREMLFRYYIAEEDKERICTDLRLTSLQFNHVIFRALKRYKKLYIKLHGEA